MQSNEAAESTEYGTLYGSSVMSPGELGRVKYRLVIEAPRTPLGLH